MLNVVWLVLKPPNILKVDTCNKNYLSIETTKLILSHYYSGNKTNRFMILWLWITLENKVELLLNTGEIQLNHESNSSTAAFEQADFNWTNRGKILRSSKLPIIKLLFLHERHDGQSRVCTVTDTLCCGGGGVVRAMGYIIENQHPHTNGFHWWKPIIPQKLLQLSYSTA